MKAAVRSELFGGGWVLGERPVPAVKAGKVLVRVKVAALNPIDYKLPRMVAGAVPGLDVAGVVEAVGAGVSEFSVGDEVFGKGRGTIAELCSTSAKNLTKKPLEMPWEVAGAANTTFLTAYQALTRHSKLRPGQSILIIGASGGCGTAGIQIARKLGAAEIVAVCSAGNFPLVQGLGATRCADYGDAQAYDALVDGSRFDVVFDCATGSGSGENYDADARKMLAPGGKRVALSGTPLQWMKCLTGLQSTSAPYWLMTTDHNGADLAAVTNLLAPLSLAVDSVHDLSNQGVGAARARVASRRARGKVLVRVAP